MVTVTTGNKSFYGLYIENVIITLLNTSYLDLGAPNASLRCSFLYVRCVDTLHCATVLLTTGVKAQWLQSHQVRHSYFSFSNILKSQRK